MRKQVALFLLSAILVCMFSACANRNIHWNKDRIVNYVQDNAAKLESFLELAPQCAALPAKDQTAIIQDKLGTTSLVEEITLPTDSVIEFSCQGAGNVTASIYTGFYYSKTDMPYPIIFEDSPLTEIDHGVYQWQNEDGTHLVYTERIRENWFYYVVKYH